jgi:hypothetical protein
MMLPEPQITPLIAATLDHLARQRFKVVVVLTGHYPKEQVDMVHRLARQAQGRHPHVRFIGFTEPEVTTPQAGDAYGGDHAEIVSRLAHQIEDALNGIVRQTKR